jgi:hypothetical protein
MLTVRLPFLAARRRRRIGMEAAVIAAGAAPHSGYTAIVAQRHGRCPGAAWRNPLRERYPLMPVRAMPWVK